MADIAIVIGWKFNHQAGMSTKGGAITAFPGGIPSQAQQDTWIAEYEAQIPTAEWEEAMEISDAALPRWAEDIHEALTLEQQQNVNAITRNRVISKQALRASRPV